MLWDKRVLSSMFGDGLPCSRYLLERVLLKQAPVVALGQFWGHLTTPPLPPARAGPTLRGRDQAAAFIPAPNAEHRQILSPVDTAAAGLQSEEMMPK